MFTCPKGHQSQAGDYCDECGTPIGATTSAAPAAASPVAAPAAAPDASAPPSPSMPCPECGTPQGGRFCEVCGYDFVLADLGGSASTSTAPAAGAGEPAPGEAGAPVAAAAGTATATATSTSAPSGWRVVVTADRAYHQRMQAQADADAEPIPFPAYVPERRFDLSGAQVLIGRRSRSRGIEPEIDLSGPPADPAVSHTHALLVAQPDGSWVIVDLDSSNGTYLGDSETPLAANTPAALADGAVVRLGAWTTLTLKGTSA